MGSEWREVSLNDLGEVARGRSRHRPRYAEHLYGGPYPFIQTGDVKASGGLITSHTQTYSEDGLAQSRLWPAGTLCITIAANIAETGILTYPACFPDSVIGFIADKAKCDVRFVEYRLRYLKAQLQREAIGSVQDNINLATFERLRFSIPDLEEQKRIARVLGSLDDKIALNRQINTTLESMAQALFKSWFVDFDPVIDNALAAGNEIPDALQKRAVARAARREALRQQTNKTTEATNAISSEQALPETDLSEQRLPSEIQQLFPDRFVLTEEMGWVPEGWEVALSGDLIDVRDGTHDSPKKSEVGYPLVTSKHITSGRLELANTYLISEKDYDDVNKRSKVETGDILLTMIGTVGIPYLVMEEKINFAIKNIGLFRTSASPEFKYYFFLLLGTHGMQTYLDARMAGTTQKYLSLKVLRNLELIKPARNVLQVFNSIVDSWFQRKTQTEKSSATLADLRDSLLPKLLSGQITIPDAEQQLAEVL